MKTNRPLGTKAREAAIAARDAARPPTIGQGDGDNAQAYRDAQPPTDADLTREFVDANLRAEYEKDFAPDTRASVYARSGGRCEVGVSRRCTGQAVSLHHRKLRRHRDHSAANALHVCAFCHHDIHADPALSYLHGWLLKAADDPIQVPWTDSTGHDRVMAP